MAELEELKKIIKDHEKRISRLESSHTVSKRILKQNSKGRKSVPDLLIILKNEDFFKKPKRLKDIVLRLEEKNYKTKFSD